MTADAGEWRVALAAAGRRARGAGARARQCGGALGARRGGRGRRRISRAPTHVRLVKGSHIVVPRIRGADDAYLCQAPTGASSSPSPTSSASRSSARPTCRMPAIPPRWRSRRRRRSICSAWREAFFASPPSRADIVWSFAGVRPLYDDAAARSFGGDARLSFRARAGRRRAAAADGAGRQAHDLPASRRGGACRAGAAFARAGPDHGAGVDGPAPLPGGDVGEGGFKGLVARLVRERSGFRAGISRGLARRYGTLVDEVLEDARGMADLGADLGGGLTEREVRLSRRAANGRARRRTCCGGGPSAGCT